MDATLEYLWAAGYDLPPETFGAVKIHASTVLTAIDCGKVPKRRGKKAAQAKRQKAGKS